MNIYRRTAVMAAGCAAALVGVSAATGAAAAPAAVRVDEATIAPIFDQPQGRSDRLPAAVANVRAQGIPVNARSTRKLAVDEGATYWAAKSSEGHYCLIAATPSGAVATACSDPAGFATHGLPLAVEEFDDAGVPTWGTSVVWVPADTEEEIAHPSRVAAIADSLFRGVAGDELSFNRFSGADAAPLIAAN